VLARAGRAAKAEGMFAGQDVARDEELDLRHLGGHVARPMPAFKVRGVTTPADLCNDPMYAWPTTWNEFLPISMPITAIAVLGV
jgi:hypothetical protein